MTDPNVIEAMNLLSAAVCSLATKGLSHKPSDAQHAIDLADEASELLAAAAEKPAARGRRRTMTDPKTMKMLDKLARAIECLADADGGEAHVEAVELARDVMLLAAAEKPAEAAPVVTGGIQFDPEGHAISPTTGTPTHVDSDGWFGFANKERAGVYVEARGLESARRAVRAMRDAGIAAVRGEAAPVAPALPWVVRRKSDGKIIAQCARRPDADMVYDTYMAGTFEVVAAPTVAAVEFNEQDRAEGHEWFAFHATDRKRVSVTIDLRPGEDAGETLAKMLAACGRGL